MTSSYGYMGYYKAPKPPRLAQAAAGKDPYGLAPNNRSGPLGIGSSHGFATPSRVATTPQGLAAVHAATTPKPPLVGAQGLGALGAQALQPTPTASGVNRYDLNTDPALQQIQALVGQSNEQAQSSALKQRQDLLLAYGDPGIAASVLGAGDPIAEAAGKNPTSTVAQLHQSRDRNLKTLDDQLNAANLGYTGYRVAQEQQAGEDYQNALAQAAAGLNSNLDTVGSNLAAALAGNNQQVVAGINSAADRASQAAITSGVDPGAAADPSALAAAAAAPTDQASGTTASLAGGGLPVGATNVDAIYQLLGRKNDPRYQY